MNLSTPRFRRLVTSAILVPLILMLVLSGMMAWQINRLLKEDAAVERSDDILAMTNLLLAKTVDMETGVRAFMVTHEREFLEPYDDARKVVDDKSDQLLSQMADHPVEAETLRKIIDARKTWQVFAVQEIAAKQADPAYMSVANEREGKQQMDATRALFDTLIKRETEVRNQESVHAHDSARTTLMLVAGIALGGGAVLAVMSRRQLLALSGTYHDALSTAKDLNQTLEDRVRQRTAELNERSQQLADANKELEAFSYSVSHDLRAPMRHIAGFSDLIRNSPGSTLSADDRENLDTIHNTARLAGRMVDDLLAFSRVGRAALRPAAVDLDRVVAECRKELLPDIAGRRVEWIVGPLPKVTADPSMLKMAVQNLLSNAVKYTATRPEAKIEIGVATAEPPAEAGTCPAGGVSFFVRDNGVGFDMAYAKKLFGVFQRLHRAEEFEGTGIGLANARRIIVRSGGLIWAKGVPDQGASFYVCLPAARVAADPETRG
jgi:signal transduction histidine kinase